MPSRYGDLPSPNCCPDEEGIKTPEGVPASWDGENRVRIAALMKKGLRLHQARVHLIHALGVRIAALMKKGLRLDTAAWLRALFPAESELLP